MSHFSGFWIPLITPFHKGSVDHEALHSLVRYYAAAGIAGLVVLGTTGEPATLSEAEQAAVLSTVLKAAGSLPVIVGVSGIRTAEVCETVAKVCASPVAGVLVSAPYYVRPSQAGIVDHFEAIADASRVPVVLYDIPARAGVALDLSTLFTLAGHDRIVAVKDCGCSPDKTRSLILDGRLDVLAGDDLDMFSVLCEGGSGAIAASAHLFTERFVNMGRLLRQGQLHEARQMWHALVPWIRAAFMEPNPAPVKAALAMQKRIHNELRAPMTPVSPALEKALEQLLQAEEAGS